MPLYICSTPAEVLDDQGRQRIAVAITDIHCELTGAPAAFVHVVFDDAQAAKYSVYGTIRAGRSERTKTALRERIAQAVAQASRIDPCEVSVLTTDMPASWVMEGGAVMPEPGEEEAWLAAQRQSGDGEA